MTDRPRWMPSRETLLRVVYGLDPMKPETTFGQDIMAVGDLIRAAVEKALAEERAKDGPLLSCPVCFAVLSGCVAQKQISHLIGCADKLDKAWQARHAREIERARLETRVSMIDKWAFCVCPFTGGTRFGATDPECPGCKDLNDARAALAALDTKADAAPTEER